MKSKFTLLIIVALISYTSCDKDDDANTGILRGNIGIYEGNCMPSPGIPPCQPSPISTTVAITAPSEHFNNYLLVAFAESNDDGTFEITLPIGKYSLFIRDGTDFICNCWSCPDECYCTPFEIKKDSVTTVYANIDHAAW